MKNSVLVLFMIFMITACEFENVYDKENKASVKFIQENNCKLVYRYTTPYRSDESYLCDNGVEFKRTIF